MLKKLVFIAVICFAFQLLGCQKQQDDRMIVMSPNVHADLVYFFKKETTDDQIFEFERTVVSIPDSKGSGYWPLPGIGSEVRVIINRYVGYALNFQPDATEEQKAFVKKRVSESPLIYKVYENVVPVTIRDL